jgi:hypothetical protein
MTGNLVNALTRLLAAGLMLGLLSPAAQAQVSKSIAGNLSVKLQGIYTPSTHLYIVGGKVQTGEESGIKKASTSEVEVTSLGLLGINPSQVVNVGGISGCLTFEPGAKEPTETAASGTVKGSLSTDTGTYEISTGTFTATLNPAGLQVILQMSGTVFTEPKSIKNEPAKRPIVLVHAALNVLLRKTAPLPVGPSPTP